MSQTTLEKVAYRGSPSSLDLSQSGIIPEAVEEFDRRLASVPSLQEQGIEILQQSYLHYITPEHIIKNWQEDPFGAKKLAYLHDAFGIRNPRKTLIEAGADDYLRLLDAGFLTVFISTQVQKPTYYFWENILFAREVFRRGAPAAVVVLDYATDEFQPINGDKNSAFGEQNFLVGVKTEVDGTETKQIARINIQPYALRENDGTIRRIEKMDEAKGYPCKDILIQVTDATDPNNFHFVEKEVEYDGAGQKTGERHITHYEGVLGMRIPGLVHEKKFDAEGKEMIDEAQESISLTDFWKIVWTEKVADMRARGQLPTAEQMPIVFAIDQEHFYRTLVRDAHLPEDTRRILKFNAPANEQLTDIFRLGEKQIALLQSLLRIQQLEIPIGYRIEDLTKSVMNNDLEQRYASLSKKKKAQKGFALKNLDDVQALIDLAIGNVEGVSSEEVLEYILYAKGLHYDERSGLLVHENDAPNVRSYYGIQFALTHGYFECSGCAGDGSYFVEGVKSAQQVQEFYGIHANEVRIPDREITDLEGYMLPPARHADTSHLKQQVNQQTIPLATENKTLKHGLKVRQNQAKDTGNGGNVELPEDFSAYKQSTEARIREIEKELAGLNDSLKERVYRQVGDHLTGFVGDGEESIYQQVNDLPLTAPMAALLVYYYSHLPETIEVPEQVRMAKEEIIVYQSSQR